MTRLIHFKSLVLILCWRFYVNKSLNRLFHTISYKKYAINLICIVFIRLFHIMSHVHCIFFAFEIKRWNGAYNNLSLMRFVHNVFQFYSNKNLKWFSKRFPIERISSKHYIFGLYFIVIALDRYKPQITNNFWVQICFPNTVYGFH